MSADEMIWRDPPPDPRLRYGKLQAFVAELQNHPKRWAVYSESAGKGMAAANRKHYPGTEWVSRGNGDGTTTVYGRWVGET
jgi:hypothetical protein